MSDDHSISRRAFGRILGATAAAGSLDALSRRDADAQTPASPLRATQHDELCEMTAVDLAARIRRKDVSAREVLAAHLSRIETVGLQIVGRHRDDLSILQMAHAFEQATHHGNRRPAVVQT